ncbi:hypothetical protein [uncultured Roseicyclus sp.]|uniref:hypothetical protein n=1 Tax=uncultured Roseicyclus sp. TaxID=543072 RepID=UPI002629124A|nr:hypothetical protein [uncultured Roseicyclus sp.]
MSDLLHLGISLPMICVARSLALQERQEKRQLAKVVLHECKTTAKNPEFFAPEIPGFPVRFS